MIRKFKDKTDKEFLISQSLIKQILTSKSAKPTKVNINSVVDYLRKEFGLTIPYYSEKIYSNKEICPAYVFSEYVFPVDKEDPTKLDKEFLNDYLEFIFQNKVTMMIVDRVSLLYSHADNDLISSTARERTIDIKIGVQSPSAEFQKDVVLASVHKCKRDFYAIKLSHKRYVVFGNFGYHIYMDFNGTEMWKSSYSFFNQEDKETSIVHVENVADFISIKNSLKELKTFRVAFVDFVDHLFFTETMNLCDELKFNVTLVFTSKNNYRTALNSNVLSRENIAVSFIISSLEDCILAAKIITHPLYKASKRGQLYLSNGAETSKYPLDYNKQGIVVSDSTMWMKHNRGFPKEELLFVRDNSETQITNEVFMKILNFLSKAWKSDQQINRFRKTPITLVGKTCAKAFRKDENNNDFYLPKKEIIEDNPSKKSCNPICISRGIFNIEEEQSLFQIDNVFITKKWKNTQKVMIG